MAFATCLPEVGLAAVLANVPQSFDEEHTMAKGEQKSNKMAKKPKKDTRPPTDTSSTSTRPMAPTTAVLPKGKLKNK